MKSCEWGPDKDQNFKGTCADKKVCLEKVKEAQKAKQRVKCEGNKLKNVFCFKYLGSTFSADGSHMQDVKRRCALASSRCGALTHVFNSDAIPLDLKLQIYRTAVCSLLTYGSEAWHLTESTMAKLNGCNASCLSHITGLSAHAEASVRTRTFDLVGAIRQRRYRWLGHILRMPNNRLIKEAVKTQFYAALPGNIFMDVPQGMSFDELEAMAQDRARWRLGMPALHQKTAIDTEEEIAALEERIKKQQQRDQLQPQPAETHHLSPPILSTPPRGVPCPYMASCPPGQLPPSLLQQLQAQFPTAGTTAIPTSPTTTNTTAATSPPLLPTPATDTTTIPRPRREQHHMMRLRTRSRQLFSYFSRKHPLQQPPLPPSPLVQAPSKHQDQMTQLRLQRRQRFKKRTKQAQAMAKPTPPPSPVSAMTPTRPTNPPTITVQHGHAPSLWAEPAYIPSEYLTTSTSSPSQASAVQQSPRASPAQTTVSPTTTTPPIISTTTQAPTLMGHRQRPIPHQDRVHVRDIIYIITTCISDVGYHP